MIRKYTQTIQVTESDDVLVVCPHCAFWELQSIDQQRHHLQSFKIKDWLPDDLKYERSKMECLDCGTNFTLNWDYTNKY